MLSKQHKIKKSLSLLYRPQNTRRGFTIVELLVVIVVIGVLASVTIVSYNGVAQRAKEMQIKSDLANASTQLKIFQVDNGEYPDTTRCDIPDSDVNKCVSVAGEELVYRHNNDNSAFSIDIFDGLNNYRVVNGGIPMLVVPISCPTGYIPVPGSVTYGTSDFCVMKYEAKNVGGVATSQAASAPWSEITPDEAINESVDSCSGCHLITESERLTIAQNLLGVASNWTSGIVGSGMVFGGHNDSMPNARIEASASDDDGYYLTGNSSSSNPEQRRTLTLTNGEVIWDFAGNVNEYSQYTLSQPAVQPPLVHPGSAGSAFRTWIEIDNPGTFTNNPSPLISGVVGINSWYQPDQWNNYMGVGGIYSSSLSDYDCVIISGGAWYSSTYAGLYYLELNTSFAGSSSAGRGFRVAK